MTMLTDAPLSGNDVSAAPALVIEGLDYSHPKGGESIPALRDLRLCLMRGELLCLAGVNGSGKSTLLCLLAGLYSCTRGRLEVLGVDLGAASETERQRVFAGTALLMQDPEAQILGASVREDLLLGLAADAALTREALALARRFGLEEHLDSPPHMLSYGQKRKLCLATALMRKPRLLLLDEPFSGLDYPAVKELRALLREFKDAGMSMVLSTHDLEPVLAFTDNVLLLSPLHPPLSGPPKTVLVHAAERGVRPPLARDFP